MLVGVYSVVDSCVVRLLLCLCGSQSATGVYLSALPTPGGIQIAGKASGDLSNEQHVLSIQKRINDAMAKNKEMYHINPPVRPTGRPGHWLHQTLRSRLPSFFCVY